MADRTWGLQHIGLLAVGEHDGGTSAVRQEADDVVRVHVEVGDVIGLETNEHIWSFCWV